LKSVTVLLSKDSPAFHSYACRP